MKRRRIALGLHPVLFALLPVVSALAANLDSTSPRSMLRPSLFTVACASILWIVLRLMLRDGLRSSAVCSFVLLMFFSYGHFAGADFHRLGSASSTNLVLGIDKPVLFIAWSGVLIGGGLVLALVPRWREELNGLFGVMAIGAMLLPVYRILDFEISLAQSAQMSTPRPCADAGLSALPGGTKPDIYYIVLDGYGSEQVLQDVFGYDNHRFGDFLADKGFFLAVSSRANYLQTRLSLASSLNMSYLDTLKGHEKLELTLAMWIRRSAVRHYLESLGYRTVAFSSGYRTTEIVDADLYLTSPGGVDSIIGLSEVLVETSALRLLLSPDFLTGPSLLQPGFAAHRNRVDFIIQQLSTDLPALPGPKFVFAHIIAPHPPFVFGSTGAPPYPPLPFTPHDADFFPGTPEQYARGYTDQLSYINRRVGELVEAILAKSLSPPIIILQGDHGPGARLIWSSPEDSDLNERTGILNAYYLPPAGSGSVYPSISPVNTFRLIFTDYLSIECPLLPDNSYFSNWAAPTDFAPIQLTSEN